MVRSATFWVLLTCSLSARTFATVQEQPETAAPREAQMWQQLDAPLLFVKRHSYTGIHIYDTYLQMAAGRRWDLSSSRTLRRPASEWKIRPVIDPSTAETLGVGVYTHPELSYDAKRLLFCFKGEPEGSTSIYEIGVDGTGLAPHNGSDASPFLRYLRG